MTRLSWKIIGYGVIVLTILDWIYSLILFSYLPHQEEHSYYEPNNDQHSLYGPFSLGIIQVFHATERLIGEYEKLLIVLSTVAIAAFTFTLWRTTTGLLSAASKQADDMRKSLSIAKTAADAAKTSADAYKVSERAWVSNFEVRYDPFRIPTEGKTGVMFTLVWTNTGRTPAIECNLFSADKIVESGTGMIPTFIPLRDREQRQAPMAPGIKAMSVSRYVVDSDIQALQKKERRLFIYGRVDYEDIFLRGTPRLTEVCLEVLFAGVTDTGVTDTGVTDTGVTDNGKMIFYFFAIGEQNKAT